MRKRYEPRLITAPPEWWAAFKSAADDNGMTLSAWIADAGAKRLSPEKRKALPPPVERGRPKKRPDKS